MLCSKAANCQRAAAFRIVKINVVEMQLVVEKRMEPWSVDVDWQKAQIGGWQASFIADKAYLSSLIYGYGR